MLDSYTAKLSLIKRGFYHAGLYCPNYEPVSVVTETTFTLFLMAYSMYIFNSMLPEK